MYWMNGYKGKAEITFKIWKSNVNLDSLKYQSAQPQFWKSSQDELFDPFRIFQRVAILHGIKIKILSAKPKTSKEKWCKMQPVMTEK